MTDAGSEQFPELRTHIRSIIGANNKPSLTDSVLPGLISSIGQIAKALRASQQVSLVGTANAFGDEQLNVDVLAEQIIRSEVDKCPSIVTLSSEEDPIERKVREESSHQTSSGSEVYTIAFDPLDGSSIIAPNWTVGTIFGIWEGSTALHQSPSTSQIASVLGVYGPRTTAVVALRIPGSSGVCFEVGIGEKDDGTLACEIVRPRIELLKPPFKTRYFAPANLRAAGEEEVYMKLISHYIEERYSLRYCGGLVPDLVHILVKGHGIYVNPVTATSKAKLRRLYELAPIALIIECAGGRVIDPATGKELLEHVIGDCDERAGLVCGTGEEVDIVKKAFGLS